MLFFYSGFLVLGIILITLVWINETRKNKSRPNDFIRDKLSEFLKITPLMHKIENLEKEFHQMESLPGQKLLENAEAKQSHSDFAISPLNSENGWKAKYEKLEILFQEKNAAFGKIEQALNNEIKNRADFEDLKYLLEEEIEKGKKKRRQLQVELDSLKMENQKLCSKLAEMENQVAPKA